MTRDDPGAGRVVVIGESLVDVVRGPDGERRLPGGSPMNVAYGLARLGESVTFVTQLGDDDDGELVRGHLRSAGVNTVVDVAWRTSAADAVIGVDGAAEYTFDIGWALAPRQLPPARVIHTGSLAAFIEPGAAAVRSAFSGDGAALRSFDPNIRPELMPDRATVLDRVAEYVERSDLVKLSDDDAAWLWPRLSLEQVGAELLALGASTVALTEGGRGATLRSRRAETRIVAAPTRVVDTIGAGDSFMAAIVAAILQSGVVEVIREGCADSDQLQRIGTAAAAAAALTVSRHGAALPAREELGSTWPGAPSPVTRSAAAPRS